MFEQDFGQIIFFYRLVKIYIHNAIPAPNLATFALPNVTEIDNHLMIFGVSSKCSPTRLAEIHTVIK